MHIPISPLHAAQQISQMSPHVLPSFSPDLTTYVDYELLVEPFPQWQVKHNVSRSSMLTQIQMPPLIKGPDWALLLFFLPFIIVSIKCLWGMDPAIMQHLANTKEKQLNKQMKED